MSINSQSPSAAGLAGSALEGVRMQNVVGRMSGTPGSVRHAGPRLGEHNREVLIDTPGFNEAQLREHGIDVAALAEASAV